jgi:ABC-2 type transport system permease protein
LKTIFKLIIKDYRLFKSDKVAVSLTFLVPIALMALWGAIFGNLDSGGPSSIRLAFLNTSTSDIAKRIEKALDTTRTFHLVRSTLDEHGKELLFDTASIKEYVRKGDVTAALVIPTDAYTDTSLGVKLNFYYDPKNAMEMEIIQGVLTRTIMMQIPDIIFQGMQRQSMRYLGPDSGKGFNDDILSLVSRYFKINKNKLTHPFLNDSTGSPTNGADGGKDFFKNLINMRSEQVVGLDVVNPWATRSVGGWAMMFLLFTLTHSAISLFHEKQSGVVVRILASPVTRVQILWGKYLYNMLLGIVQLVVLFSAGALMFQIDILSHWLNLIIIIIMAAGTCTSFGMLLAAVSKTPSQANGLGTFIILVMSSMGGAWFPTSFMPAFIQLLSKGTIVYWAMDGFLKVLWQGLPLSDLLPNIGALAFIATIVTGFSILRFKKGDVF